MKNLILSIFLVSIIHISKAQSWVYHPFPADSAIWMQDGMNSGGYLYAFRTYMLGDTIISSLNYKKVYSKYLIWPYFSTTPISPSDYIGSMRQDIAAKKVYFIDYWSTTENILYDFDLTIGDTISGNAPGDTVFVAGIDSTLVGGVYHKTFILGNTSFATSALVPGKLIEGVGCDAGFKNLYASGFEFENNLLCLATYGNVIYPSGPGPYSVGYCSYAVGVGELKNNELKLTVMPNPVVNDIHIVVNCNEQYDIEIRNNYGSLVYKRSGLQFNGPVINFTDFSAGVYFISLRDSKGNTGTKKIVKQ